MHIIFLWIAYEVIFYLTHVDALTEKEIRKLSKKRKSKYIKRNYKFTDVNVDVDKKFKSAMNAKGKLYSINHSLRTFPSYVASLLKGKKHEWIILGFECEGIVKYIWMNKGFDNSSVSLNFDINDIVSICKEMDCHTIICFHNHPNSDPNRQTCLLASEQDRISAKSTSEIVNSHGINWIEFVCERGKYLKYFSKFSVDYFPNHSRIEYINSQNNLSPKENYRLHRELGLIFRF